MATVKRRCAYALVGVVACSLDESGLELGPGDASLDRSLDVATNDTSADVVDAPTDVPEEPPPPPCNPAGAFGSFLNLGSGVNTGALEAHPSLTSDELMMFFARDTGGNHLALFYATRGSTSQQFAVAAQATSTLPQSGPPYDSGPSVVDGLGTLYYDSVRAPSTRSHVYRATGSGAPNGWSGITEIAYLNASDPFNDIQPFWVPATSEIWFASDRTGFSLDIYVFANGGFTPVFAAPLNTTSGEIHPTLSHDGLAVFFARKDTSNVFHTWVATRPSTTGAVGAPTQLTEFDTGAASSIPGWLSLDGCRMYFTSNRPGSQSADLWMATRAP